VIPKCLKIMHIRSYALFLMVLATGIVISNSAANQGHGKLCTGSEVAELDPASLTGGRYAIENIIIMVIDGLRNEEAFDDSPYRVYGTTSGPRELSTLISTRPHGRLQHQATYTCLMGLDQMCL